MLNKFELRLGNLYRNAETGQVIESTSSFIIDVYKEEKDVEMYEGVEITPEWLGTAGFEKDTNGWYDPNSDFSLTDKYYPCWLDKMLWPQDVEKYKGMKMEHLHHLQNLYYDLTNTPLEFTYDNN